MILLAEEVNPLWKWPNFLLLVGLLGYLIRKHGGPLPCRAFRTHPSGPRSW